jgi:hypothetical protein
MFDKGQTKLVEYPAGGTNSSDEIPVSVTTIAQNAFNSCTNLANVVIGGGVSSIGPYAFLGCQGLTNITIQSGVAAIGGWAFEGCASLKSVAIPDSVSEIGPFAFTSCGSLPGIALPKALTILDDGVFSYCPNLTNITISPLVTSIGAGAFFGCSNLSTVVLPEYVASLGSNAFQNCASLTGVYSFQGNATSVVDPSVFSNVGPAAVYYLPGTSGWGATFGGLPTAPWALPYPVALNQSAGVQSNQFSFTVSWATNLSVIVEASTNLADPVWSPLATNALAGGVFQFGDPGWTNYPARFYRVRSQ